ncbi:hypothetical protein FALBO_16315 [Fusarium albosuccineum]|uniref:Ethyl tert-butyl ether degradation EthD n=2 Tax=Fusarium decemcellulare species complex TaxID=1329916 RepID=A0A8H4NUB5_9HYPO|nr:hypothetical protein FALBO_16315 [Fusarium albosuccineum]KAF4978358.1 hypothetical protein FDECE_18235 [Fusarium decemcellulare]KAJ3540703.1 hypothetical protein NM208_g4941 [Fusarium decemcellulare]
MVAKILVLYPSGQSFDHGYYLKTHMPLVSANWGPLGLQDWEILTFPADAPYQVQATLRWKSVDDFNRASSGEAADKVFGDIKNFFPGQPVLLKGDVVATEAVASKI